LGASRSADGRGHSHGCRWRWKTGAAVRILLEVCLQTRGRVGSVFFDYCRAAYHGRLDGILEGSLSCRHGLCLDRRGTKWSRWPWDTTVLALPAFLPLLGDAYLLLAIDRFCVGWCGREMFEKHAGRFNAVRNKSGQCESLLWRNAYTVSHPLLPGSSVH
jgi:hypothetical protein